MEPDIAKLNLGQILKNRRESLRNSIETASMSTKLSERVIKLLETNQFSEIGSHVYVRGYIGIYAKYLGEDINRIISIYDDQTPAPEIKIKPAIILSESGQRKQLKKHSKTLSGIITICFFCSLLYGYSKIEPFVFNYENSPKIDDTSSTIKSIAPDNKEKEENLIITPRYNFDDIDDIEEQEEEKNNKLATPEIKLESLSSSEPEVDSDKDKTKKDDIENSSNDKKTNISITFSDNCWLTLIDATGETIASREYSTKKSLNISAILPFTVKVAKPEAIEKILLGDDNIELSKYKTGRITYTIKNE